MSNTLLTPDDITRESLRILHQKLNFIGNVNLDYDDRYAKSGAKIGDSLRIRLPTQYTVTDGATMDQQDSEQQSVTMTVNNRKHVGMNFTDEELTLDMDRFSELHIQPAMAVLAANVESDVLENVYKDVYNQVDNVGSAATFAKLMEGRKKLIDNLAPPDSNLNINLNTQDNVDLVDALKGLFQDSTAIKKQYRDGMMGRTAGFNFFENTMMPNHTSGSDDGTGDYLTNDATAQTGSSITVDTGTGTLKAGDIVTIEDVNRVHPETKQDTGELQQFTVTEDASSNATTIKISPEIIASGAKQNVTNGAEDDKKVTKVGGASANYGISLAYHRDAFGFATADLEMPKGTDQASRRAMDGLSLLYVRDYDIVNAKFRARIDILYGYKSLRPQLACRLANN